ncbi:MAG: type IV toxin-antitoxin system AbiEi family antitoxin domain-containing protein [Bifidobacteriaceae bacterium]|jgi:predicted transcriptional regulator of viral defense system|nr:type IV toxin-antitoxin system AbiEi family antitoxin domain-containing protein [Bifidobacteriaceae bacterium]
MLNEVVTHVDRLREIAMDQHGFVTLAQAMEAGVPQPQIAQLTARGRLDRVAHGVYRVPQVPATRYDNWARAVLWTGASEACLSHETALAAWGISDINPDRIHVNVAKRRRLRRAGGDQYVVHHHDLAPGQVTWFEQIPITTVATTIDHCIDWGLDTYLIKQALERGGKTSRLPRADRERLARKLEERDHGHR